MDSTPGKQVLIKPEGLTPPTPSINTQQNMINNSARLMQPPGMNQTLNQADFLQLYGMNQSLNSAGFMQSPGMNQTLNSTNFMQSPGMNHTIYPANLLGPFETNPALNQTNFMHMNQNVNSLGYPQQFRLNPNLNPMGYQQQPRMNPNFSSMGPQQQFGMGFTAPPPSGQKFPSPTQNPQMTMQSNQVARTPTGSSVGSTPTLVSVPSGISRLPTPTPAAFESPMFDMNQLTSLNMNYPMNWNMNTNATPHQQPHPSSVNGLQNLPTNMTSSQQLQVPVTNGAYHFANANMDTNPTPYLSVATGLQSPSVESGMSMNMNFPQTPSPRNSIPRRSQSQLPRAGPITQAPRRMIQVFGPQHPGPTRVKKNLVKYINGCSNNRLSITPNMTPGASIITPELRAPRAPPEAAIATKATPSSAPQTTHSSQSPQQSVQQKSEQGVEQVQQPVPQPGTEEQIPPTICLKDLLVFLSDRHWEFWHRLNFVEACILAEAYSSDDSIRQAWYRRVSDRWFSGDDKRVYELGGYLYEVKLNLDRDEKPPSVTPIPWREYARCVADIRPACCSSIDLAQALVDVRARAQGNTPPHIQALDQAQAQSESILGGGGGINSLVGEMDGFMKGLTADAEPLLPSTRQMGDWNAALIEAKAEEE